MNNEPQAKRRRDLSTVEDFYRLGKEVQNRSGQKLCAKGKDASESILEPVSTQPSTLGLCSISITSLIRFSEVPHMLWAMYFVKCYPLTQEACAAAGGTNSGAVDPKTWKKYVWPMIYALADLEAEVVSLFLFVLFIFSYY